MKPKTKINWIFALSYLGFFLVIIFIAASDYLFSTSLAFIKFLSFDTCVSVIYGFIAIAAIVILFKVGRQIFNNLNK